MMIVAMAFAILSALLHVFILWSQSPGPPSAPAQPST